MLRFKKTTYINIDAKQQETEEKREIPEVPEGLWSKCPHCGQILYNEDRKQAHSVCPKCGYYFRMDAYERIAMVADEYTFQEWDVKLEDRNPLDFKGYEKKLETLRQNTGLSEAVITGRASVYGEPCALAVCDARFMMASMGHTVGEKITRAVERATKERLPVVMFTCSGGARMQEGIISLMQMAKTSAALKQHSDAGLLSIVVLTDPTTGGVTASFAMLGDIILGEPGALVGFAGPRVIEQTIGQKLPEGFQRTEFLLEHGLIDAVVERKDLKQTLFQLLHMHSTSRETVHMGRDTIRLADRDKKIEKEKKKQKDSPDAWERVRRSRMQGRPTALDYIELIFKNFYELHGDRAFRDDGAIVGGIASVGGIPVTVIGQQKGKNTKDNIKRNFGMPNPEGYRKALRLMKQAEKFGRPIICFVDTPGAFCGMEAEERGQGEAIARNLYEMAALTVPVLTILIGEGGSGGALAMAVANEVWMMENATYSILSPEGFASILWKDSSRAQEAAGVMKITAEDLKRLGIIERIIPEVSCAGEENLPELAAYMKQGIKEFIEAYRGTKPQQLADMRYERFRKM
ncbi:MAG: acetyl-CoA carboxylase carboxyltransferase subunit beta [Lachnospiraceae bacterium]|nr:acetyl-CoA carboxylase carboxyltransferase subunit beta [Lachnospiraceae bacterium]